MITKAYIRSKAAEMGFTAACFCTPIAEDEAPENIKCLVLLLKSYCPHDGLADAFYIAKNESYNAVKRLSEDLVKMGASAPVLSNLRLKHIASRCAGLQQGRNTLHYHKELGSKFCMELLGLNVMPEGCMEETSGADLPCESCKRCMTACPGGAITEHGFEKEKCIRFYMIGGKPMPLHLRDHVGTVNGSYAMVGCDICQRVCPENRKMEALRTAEKEPPFTLEELLWCSDEMLERFGAMYGRNYAVRNRVIAQALLAAGNSGDADYLPIIRAYTQSPSPLVREYALWAAEKMTNLQKIY